MELLFGNDRLSQPKRNGSILALRLISDSPSENPRGSPCASGPRANPGIFTVDGSWLAATKKPFNTAAIPGLNALAVTGGNEGGGGGGMASAALWASCAAVALACAAAAAVFAACASASAFASRSSSSLI